MRGPKAPPPRDYAKETRDTLEAQIDLAPELYAAEAEFAPQYAQLDAQIIQDILGGDDGLLSFYKDDLQPGLAGAEAAGRSVSREADIADVESLGRRSFDAVTSSNPLLGELSQQALNELSAGASMDPALEREVEQFVRQGQADRGFGYGGSDLAQEVLFKGSAADNLRRNRQNFGMQVAGMTGDPLAAILGRPSVNMATGMGVSGQASSMVPQVFNPESAYAGSLNANNYNAQLQANMQRSQNRAGLAAGALGMFGSLGGGYLAGR